MVNFDLADFSLLVDIPLLPPASLSVSRAQNEGGTRNYRIIDFLSTLGCTSMSLSSESWSESHLL